MMKKTIFIIMLFPVFLYAQGFKALGGKTGLTVFHSVWDVNDPLINNFYPEKPNFYNAYISIYGEFISKKTLSTCIDLSYHLTDYRFDYTMYDKYGQSIGTSTLRNSVQYISILVKEKFRTGNDLGINYYAFAGPRIELEFNKNVDKDFTDVFDNTNKIVAGITAGGGISYNFNTFQVLGEVFWHGDVLKTYSSGNGKILNNSIGILLGAGWYVPNK
jgi:hypothetical protein